MSPRALGQLLPFEMFLVYLPRRIVLPLRWIRVWKTTLLRLLAGFEKPTTGRLYIDGVDVTDVPPYERPVNMMFQSYALFPHMTVAQNVAFGLKQERLPVKIIRERVKEGLDLVQMGAFAERKPHQLSGGNNRLLWCEASLNNQSFCY
jgi:putrescine transport system ATP-binding protein